MKHLLLLSMAILFTMNAKSQSANPQVISSAGNTINNGTYSVSWTLGETVIATISNSNYTLTQGFHQSSYTIVDVKDITKNAKDIKVYPNPTIDEINIDWDNYTQNGSYYAILDMQGKLIDKKEIQLQKEKVNMAELATGSYFLKIFDKSNAEIKTIKIQKVSLK